MSAVSATTRHEYRRVPNHFHYYYCSTFTLFICYTNCARFVVKLVKFFFSVATDFSLVNKDFHYYYYQQNSSIITLLYETQRIKSSER